MKSESVIILVAFFLVSTIFVTLITLPSIDYADPDPYFHIKATPIAYWVSFSSSLVTVFLFSLTSLKKNLRINALKGYKFLGFLSIICFAFIVFVIPRLMYVNKIYTDTYPFVGEVLYVLRSGHVGFYYSFESPALSTFVAQMSLITGFDYISLAEFLPLVFPFCIMLFLFVATLPIEFL